MSNTEKAMAKTERVEAWMKGKAPLIDKENYKISLIKFLNWHNEFTDIKDLRKTALKNFAKYPSLVNATDEELRQVGILSMVTDSLTDIDQTLLTLRVETLAAKYITNMTVKPKVVPIKRAIDAVTLEANRIAERIDLEMDNQLTLNGEGNFDVALYIDNCKVTAAVARKLGEYFTPILQDFEEVVIGKDEQLNEGYSCYPKPRIKRMMKNLLVPLLDKLETLVRVKRAERKQRTRKEKPAGALVKSVQYLKEFPELKLQSIEPKKVIGASQVWLYNTKYKKLTVLISADGKGLTIKGTTIYGFNPEESKTKIVRKPNLVLAEITKRKLNFHMKQMKTSEQEANGRINSDTIILTV